MSTETLVNWLEQSTELGRLSREILQAIARSMEPATFPPGFRVVIEDTPVTNLYILERGQADRYRRKQPGLMWASSLLPGAISKPNSDTRLKAFNKDREMAATTRQTVLSKIAGDRTLMFAAHFPAPGIGNLRSIAWGGFDWLSVNWQFKS
ncbi:MULTISPECIES: hypothetical protein [unclassified Microcoleus]|uniref:hypothetical protein n=1 Tax=unclassified Microcoleus TaxID=2642155 RepID=UPI002FD4B627